MKKRGWERKIKEQCEAAGTYQPHHDPVISTLASILAKRDEAEAQYKENGSEPTIVYISDRGSKNMTKNPALQIIIDLNNQALAFWRDLGLTPAGFKKLNGDALTAKATTAGFAELIAKLSE